jgi:hypothetical protein
MDIRVLIELLPMNGPNDKSVIRGHYLVQFAAWAGLSKEPVLLLMTMSMPVLDWAYWQPSVEAGATEH